QGGMYFTVILRPEVEPTYAPLANLMASVAVATTIGKLYGLTAAVKWPNDVLIHGKKVCGILSELEMGGDAVKFINVGIGINANTAVPRFADSATSLKEALGRDVSRREFLKALILEIESRRDSLMDAGMLEEWKYLSTTLNCDVRIIATDGVITGRAVDVDSTGALILRHEDGSLKKIVAGDCTQ
ncbi:MAG: biotin--[acetyl-CoA-carboxylase] ligase, partial [Dehalococcoidia bacterium]